MLWSRYLASPARSQWLLPIVLAMAVLMLVVNEWTDYAAREGLASVQSHIVQRHKLREVQRLILEAESAQRGYLLTGELAYRKAYEAARAREAQALADLRRVNSHPNGQVPPWLGELESLISSKLSELQETIALHDAGQAERALELMQTGIGLTFMQQLDALISHVLEGSFAQIHQSMEVVSSALWIQRIGLGLLVLLSMGTIVMLALQARREQAVREGHSRQLQVERDKLEEKVRERTQELAVLAEHLQNVREDERAHLARELHDELGSLLTAAKLDVARIKNRMQSPDHADLVADRLTHLVQTLDAGIALKRRIIEDLRPSTLSNLGLTTALEVLCKEFDARCDALVVAHIEEVSLPANMQLTAYRLAQEALTNIGKYAQAHHVRVSLRTEGDCAVMCVEDDGCGFDPQALRMGAHGLSGMRFRVVAHGGRFEIRSAVDAGTAITAWLPQAISPPSDARS